MSKQTWIAAAALGLLTVLGAQGARAQGFVRPPTSPFPRPPVSPWINLFRGGNPAINYYGLVRPEQQYNQAINQLQQGVQANQAALYYGDPNLPTTGHPTRFLNYSHYFLSQGGGGNYAPYGAGAPGTGLNPNLNPAINTPGFNRLGTGVGGGVVPRVVR
jgi:hypothetical protein